MSEIQEFETKTQNAHVTLKKILFVVLFAALLAALSVLGIRSDELSSDWNIILAFSFLVGISLVLVCVLAIFSILLSLWIAKRYKRLSSEEESKED